MPSETICILGGSGFVGSHIAAKLSKNKNVRVLSRNPRTNNDKHTTGQTEFVQTDVHDPEKLKQHLVGADAVINLIGILNESGHDGSGFYQAHVELAKKVAAACQSNNISRLLHMSALNASTSGPSHYLRTKGEAEDFVHSLSMSNIHVTSFRPSVIFGPGDSFFNRFAQLLKYTPYIFPLACAQAKFAPVYVGDVADRFINALDNPSSYAKRIDLCGPHEYTLKELVEYTASTLGLKRKVIGLPDTIARLQANLLEWVPGKPFSLDNYHSLQVDSICCDGVKESSQIEEIVPQYLRN